MPSCRLHVGMHSPSVKPAAASADVFCMLCFWLHIAGPTATPFAAQHAVPGSLQQQSFTQQQLQQQQPAAAARPAAADDDDDVSIRVWLMSQLVNINGSSDVQHSSMSMPA
jgi:hypothetical protein